MAECVMLNMCGTAFKLKQMNYTEMYDNYCIKQPDECIRKRLLLEGYAMPEDILPNGDPIFYPQD